jgi:hypothetical protein
LLTVPSLTSRLQSPDNTYGWSSCDAVDVALPDDDVVVLPMLLVVALPMLLVVVLVPVMPVVLPVELSPPTMVCDSVVLPVALPDSVVFPDDVMLPVLPVVVLPMLVALVDDVPVWFVLFVTVVPVSKIIEAIEPLAENVDPCVLVALVLVALLLVVALPVLLVVVLPMLVVVFPVAAVLPVEVELPELDGLGLVPYCAIAGVRLNAAAKSPKTSTSGQMRIRPGPGYPRRARPHCGTS